MQIRFADSEAVRAAGDALSVVPELSDLAANLRGNVGPVGLRGTVVAIQLDEL